MKSYILTLLISFAALTCFSQQLEVKGAGADLYLAHSVAAKENFYSIGRLYNVSPKEIAAYNKITMESGLSVGQDLKIPLTPGNFIQSPTASPSPSLVPVVHSVEPKEGLYRISTTYNKVPIDVLKKWNHLPGDEISIGSPLIVGFLKIDKSQSTLASSVKASPAVVKVEEKKSVEKKPDVGPTMTPPIKTTASAPDPNASSVLQKSPEPARQVVSVAKGGTSFDGGYFKKLYSMQVNSRNAVSENGNASVFKSTSGWKDGKYYCFNNTALPGSIIQVTLNSTGKSVFAKVLDVIPEIKQNEGLALIISNSAAAELGASGGQFDCTYSFVK